MSKTLYRISAHNNEYWFVYYEIDEEAPDNIIINDILSSCSQLSLEKHIEATGYYNVLKTNKLLVAKVDTKYQKCCFYKLNSDTWQKMLNIIIKNPTSTIYPYLDTGP